MLLKQFFGKYADNTQEPKSQYEHFDAILQTYEIKIGAYVEQRKKQMPFNIEIHDDLLQDELLCSFFEEATWKSEIVTQISDFSQTYKGDPYISGTKIVPTLQQVCDLNLTYAEFDNTLRKEIQRVLDAMPENRKNSSYNAALIDILRLVRARYNKVLVITGESGSGKTHLINNIVSGYKLDRGSNHYSINIPLLFSGSDIEYTIISSLNDFLGTQYSELLEFERMFSNLSGYSIKVFFIIDDLQKACHTEVSFYKNLKSYVEKITIYDWISWCISINEFDQYLIIDDTDFLSEYCFCGDSSIGRQDTDLSNLFVNVETLNVKHRVFENIMRHYSVNPQFASGLPTNKSHDIAMLKNNPLMCHVYANTVEEIESDVINVCYFDFIKRYAEIKKKEMITSSRRNLPSTIEVKEQIEQDISVFTHFLIETKKLRFKNEECKNLFIDFAHCYHELRSAHLIMQDRLKISDPLSENQHTMKTQFVFVFKMYWAYKILLQHREMNDWEEYTVLRNSFDELQSELLMYELLYLDFTGYHEAEIEKEISDALRAENGREVLFFVLIKMSFRSQKVLFSYIKSGAKMDFSKTELFSLMYFLLNTNAKIPDIFGVVNRYLDDICANGLGLFLVNVAKRKFARLDNLTKLKKCISQFIFSTDIGINTAVGKTAATNFYRIVTNQDFNLDNIMPKIIGFLSEHSDGIKKSREIQVGSVCFMEYFLRYLFANLIQNSESPMQAHDILLKSDDYYINDKPDVAHIIRTSVVTSYGYVFRTLRHGKKAAFKRRYIDGITELINSGNLRLKILAYHFIANTLADFEDPDVLLEPEFIPLLMQIYEDERLEKFNTSRTDFYKRNLSC